ncbi:MAG TPA: hypothetical protein PKY78_05420 [Candidatus Omnitrophota bacterium]|nr:hypothetical protein [Candidatus Omnitrophota bacterium]
MNIIVKVIEILAHAAFPAVVFAISSNITLMDLLDEIHRPARLIRMTVITTIAVPIMTAVIFKIFHADIIVTGIALIAAIAPGDSFALLETESKKGRIVLAAVIMSWLCLIMPFTVPIWLGAISHFFPLDLKASPAGIFRTVAPLTIVPFIIAVILRAALPAISDICKKIAGIFFKWAVIVVTVAALFYIPKGLSHFTWPSIAAIFCAVSVSLFAGYYCGLAERKDRLTSALTASLGNFALVLLVAHLSYPHVHIIAQAVVFIVIRWVVIAFWYLLLLKNLERKHVSL